MSTWDEVKVDVEKEIAHRKETDERNQTRVRKYNVSEGMVQCSNCNGWFYDTPGNFCSYCI